jgi:hypothetical protein
MNAAKGLAASTLSNNHLLSEETNVKLFKLIVGGQESYLFVFKMAMARPQDCLPRLTASDSSRDGDAHESC